MTKIDKATILSLITTISTVITCIYVIKTFRKDHERRRKQATIEMFRAFKISTSQIEEELFLKYGDNEINVDEIDKELWIRIKNYLSALESFAAGVNLNIYDLAVANRISGAFFIRKFHQFIPFILDYRRKKFDDSLYEEFEQMIRNLESLRSKYDKHHTGIIKTN